MATSGRKRLGSYGTGAYSNATSGSTTSSRTDVPTDIFGQPLYTNPYTGEQDIASNIYPVAPEEPAPIDSSGGGSGGGGVAPYDPTTDPMYQAYISSLDLDLAQRQADTARRRGALLGQQDNLLTDLGTQGEQSRQGISGAAEARGLYDSGARLRDIARQQANQATRESRIRESTTTGVSDLEYALAQAIAQNQLKRQNASQGLFQ